MLVDVIMTTYAGRQVWITEAIDSVLRQTYPDWRLTVVDDASPDDKSSFVRERYASERDRIEVVRLERNRGHFGAKMEGIRRTSREAIAFIDDDDRWHPQKLELQADRLRRPPRVEAVHTDVHYIDEAGEIIAGVADRQNARRAAIDYETMDAREQARSLFAYYSIRSASTLVLREALDRAGGFDEKYLGTAEQDFWVRFAATGHRLAHVAAPLYDRRVHGGNMSLASPVTNLDARLEATDRLVAAFPFLEDLAEARKSGWLKAAVAASLRQGDAAAARRAVRELIRREGLRPELGGAWVLSWLGPLRRPMLRARAALKKERPPQPYGE